MATTRKLTLKRLTLAHLSRSSLKRVAGAWPTPVNCENSDDTCCWCNSCTCNGECPTDDCGDNTECDNECHGWTPCCL